MPDRLRAAIPFRVGDYTHGPIPLADRVMSACDLPVKLSVVLTGGRLFFAGAGVVKVDGAFSGTSLLGSCLGGGNFPAGTVK